MSAAPVTTAKVSLEPLRRIGIIGAGQMGSGIAHVCALAGIDVVLTDINEERCSAAGRRSSATCRARSRAARSAKKTRMPRSRASNGADYALFADCDMVIEAATENEEVKREIFKKLMPHLKPDALIATNTSSISITRLAAATDRPGNSSACIS